MAHLTDIPYLYGNNIMQYLDLFAKDLLLQHNYNLGHIKVLIVGGAALALKYNFRGTVDVDADIKFGGAIRRSVDNVSKYCNIPNDWLNQDFVKSYSFSRGLWDDAIYIRTLQNYLDIFVVSDISQLCMKLSSGRKKDIGDIELLIDKCYSKKIDEQMVLSRYDKLYGDRTSLKQNAVKVMKRRYRYLKWNFK